MDFEPPNSPYEGEIDPAAIIFTESLAGRVSFENYLFDHKARRRAVHTMDIPDSPTKPLVITSEQIRSTFPEEVRDILRDGGTIEHLSVLQEETDDLAFFIMKFHLNGTPHSLTSQSNEDKATYTTHNDYGDTVRYSLPKSTTQALLASFVYIREYLGIKGIGAPQLNALKEAHGENFFDTPEMFSIEESNIYSQRIEECDFIERMIMTLGHFEGISQVTTSGLIPAGNRLILAELSRTESPAYTHASNDLDLSVFSGDTSTSIFDRLSLTQQFAEINAFKGEDFSDQIGEIAKNNNTLTVSAQNNPKEWGVLCSEFAKVMREELGPYLYHDEAV